MEKFNVSIIIPVYNVEKYLIECLESAVNQTLDNIEIICINDGSTDGSLKILEEYYLKYKNIKIINQENAGLSAARNSGIKVAKGKYLYFLDSDDYIELNSMEECFNISEIEKLDILTFDANVFYDSDFKSNNFKERYHRESMLSSEVMNGEEFYNLSNKVGAYYAPVWLNFYKSDFIKENNLYFYEGILHEDELHTMSSFIKANRIKYISKKFFNRRIRNNSIMTSKINIKRAEGNFITAKEAYKLYLNNELALETRNRLLFWIRRYYNNSIFYCDVLNCNNIRRSICQDINNKSKLFNIDLDMQVSSPSLYYSNEDIVNEMDSLFLVHTPYHMILAISMALSDEYRSSKNDIFIWKTFDLKSINIENLEKIFNNVIYLENKDIFNVNIINSKINKKVYNNIFANSDREVHTQYIVKNRLKNNGNFYYLEDGTAVYTDEKFPIEFTEQKIEEIYKNINLHVENIQVCGTLSKIKKRYLIYPHLVRDELRDGKENLEIESDLIKIAIENIYSEFQENIDYLNKTNVLIALELSDFFIYNNSDVIDYAKVVYEIIYRLNQKKVNIYLKYHPREKNKYLDNYIIESDNVKFIKNSIAIEAFYSLQNLYLISRVSTSLMTFSKILGSKRAICIDKIFDENSNRLIEVFEKLNIFLPNTIDDVIQKIDSKI